MFGRSCVKQDQKWCTLWLSTLILPRRSLPPKLHMVAVCHVKFDFFHLTSKVRPSRHRFSPQNPRTLYTNLLCRIYYLVSAFFLPRLLLSLAQFVRFFIFYSLQLLCHSLINYFIHYLFFIFPFFLFPIIFPFLSVFLPVFLYSLLYNDLVFEPAFL
jgi:hypothetical protein